MCGVRGAGQSTPEDHERSFSYPTTRRGSDADDHHGEVVPDPYRWLEETDAPETAEWVRAQNEVTESFLASVPSREPLRARLTGLWDYPRYGVPFARGKNWFQTRQQGLENQPSLWVMEAPDATGRRILDPNDFSVDGTVAVTSIEVSEDGSLVAYATSSAGSDWRTWRVRDVASGRDLDDLVEWSKYSNASWRHDGSGFYYGAIEPPAPGGEYLQESRSPRIFFHAIGAKQPDDELVFASTEPDWLLDPKVSDDGRYLVVSIERGTFPEAQLHVLDLSDATGRFRPLVSDFASEAYLVTSSGPVFYLVTDYGAGRRRVVSVDIENPGREHWKEVVGESDDTLVSARFFGGRLVCHYLRHASSLLRVHELSGALVREIPVEEMASVGGPPHYGGIEGRATGDTVHFLVMSFTDSGSIWSHDLASGRTEVVRSAEAAVDRGRFVTEQVFVRTPDGASVPMFLTRDRDLVANGEVPVLLTGYGGFNVPIAPYFTVPHAVWLEEGGILAVANLRGGGEYGRAWHDAGRLANKQNVFDDFCACARWLADSGWSRPERIAINGGSNGGLLVGACLVQHPELFGAAVAEVGVFDMLRFHRFTIGWAWTSDFGDPEDPGQYGWVRGYSPLHNVRAGERYPATMLVTGDHDDRVVPGHSFKFAAALQAAQSGDAPILLRVETDAGHGQGKPTAKAIAEATDVMSFVRAALDAAPRPAS